MRYRDSVAHEQTANDPRRCAGRDIQLQNIFYRKKEMTVISFEFDGIYSHSCIMLREVMLSYLISTSHAVSLNCFLSFS